MEDIKRISPMSRMKEFPKTRPLSIGKKAVDKYTKAEVELWKDRYFKADQARVAAEVAFNNVQHAINRLEEKWSAGAISVESERSHIEYLNEIWRRERRYLDETFDGSTPF